MLNQAVDRKRCASCEHWRGPRQPGATPDCVAIDSETVTGLCEDGGWAGSERRAPTLAPRPTPNDNDAAPSRKGRPRVESVTLSSGGRTVVLDGDFRKKLDKIISEPGDGSTKKRGSPRGKRGGA